VNWGEALPRLQRFYGDMHGGWQSVPTRFLRYYLDAIPILQAEESLQSRLILLSASSDISNEDRSSIVRGWTRAAKQFARQEEVEQKKSEMTMNQFAGSLPFGVGFEVETD